MRRTPRRAGLSEERRMAGGGKEDRLRDADGRQQSQTDAAVASGGIMDEDNRSASVQEATCVKRQNTGRLQLYTSILLWQERTRPWFI